MINTLSCISHVKVPGSRTFTSGRSNHTFTILLHVYDRNTRRHQITSVNLAHILLGQNTALPRKHTHTHTHTHTHRHSPTDRRKERETVFQNQYINLPSSLEHLDIRRLGVPPIQCDVTRVCLQTWLYEDGTRLILLPMLSQLQSCFSRLKGLCCPFICTRLQLLF